MANQQSDWPWYEQQLIILPSGTPDEKEKQRQNMIFVYWLPVSKANLSHISPLSSQLFPEAGNEMLSRNTKKRWNS
jgi:hypothetical protein